MPALKMIGLIMGLLLLLAAVACGSNAASMDVATDDMALAYSRPATPQMIVGFAHSRATPTSTLTQTPVLSETMAPVIMTVIVTQTVVAPTRTELPTSTPTLSPTVIPGINCDDPSATIDSPTMNAVVRGTTTIMGTANPQDFAYYKIQYMPNADRGSEKWGELARSSARVEHGTLMQWDTRIFEPGVYWLRLLVHHSDGNYGRPCEIRVIVAR